MSNSQEQSLNEDVVFAPISESSPEFLHCERERRALECLLRAGPGPFYSKLNQERLGPFLSPEEVKQLCGWAQDYRCSEDPLEEIQAAEGEGSPELQDFSIGYWPVHSDTPVPDLELGWPERQTWAEFSQTTVYTSPPMEQAPPIREVVRRLIQGAHRVVAMVTDRLSDSAVIGDLHAVASRGVPVYIILNQRSVLDNVTPLRLRHQNISVRVLGGRTFCSREGRMVVGELKDNFLLVDLDTVMLGSYSPTWADAHLHRQLVTVFSGQVAECFDQEFRILYAASSPIPITWRPGKPPTRAENVQQPPERTDRQILPLLPLDIPGHVTPPPPTDSPLDWEALGVTSRNHFPESPVNLLKEGEGPALPPLKIEQKASVEEEPPPCKAECEPGSPPVHLQQHRKQQSATETCVSPDNESTLRDTPRALYRPHSLQTLHENDDRQIIKPMVHKTEIQPVEEECASSVANQQRNEEKGRFCFSLRRDSAEGTGLKPQATGPGLSSERVTPPPKKPLILRVPVSQTGNGSALSDVLKRLQPRLGRPVQPVRSALSAGPALSRSMLDLSLQPTEPEPDMATPPRRSQANCTSRLTPAQALMTHRNNETKSGVPKPPKVFLPPSRPRSSSFGFGGEWQRPQWRWDRTRRDPDPTEEGDE
ncbi:protein FAM83E [Megalops cyprinoides]|uniref:protein FAM83E n=1 Tax=Megalops cyprinoides TaxID=118141 RepID=UPI00186424D0|nr:protein FAM83E [Megalops cyprinoides]